MPPALCWWLATGGEVHTSSRRIRLSDRSLLCRRLWRSREKMGIANIGRGVDIGMSAETATNTLEM